MFLFCTEYSQIKAHIFNDAVSPESLFESKQEVCQPVKPRLLQSKCSYKIHEARHIPCNCLD